MIESHFRLILPCFLCLTLTGFRVVLCVIFGDSYYVLLIHTTHSGTYRERSSVVEVTQEWIFLEMQRKYNQSVGRRSM